MKEIILPEPTFEQPFAQIDFIFNRVAATGGINGKNIKSALSYYKRIYLAATHNYSDVLRANKLFYLIEQWDEFALIKFQKFMDNNNISGKTGRLSSSSVVNTSNVLRKVLDYAILHKLIQCDHIHAVACPPVIRETSQNAAYSDQEMDVINTWLKVKLEEIYKWISVDEYVPIGTGRDPRITFADGKVDEDIISDFGWENINNLRWYFENVMNCEAALKPAHHNQRHYHFYLYASKYPGGYECLVKDWKIKPLTTMDLIMPLALKLSLETGLNPTSLWNLNVDCLQESHPLSGVPFLKYYKARSQGNMEMHLNIYDKNACIREFKEGQVNVIRKTIDAIKRITSYLRIKSPKKYSQKLFIVQVPGYVLAWDEKRPSWKIRDIDEKNSSEWFVKQVIINGLKSDNGNRLQLTVGRFRSTKITDMVKRGVDFFEIQSHCGHQSILTTFRYISQNNLEIKARSDVHKAISTIYENNAWQKETQPEYVSGSCSATNSTLYKGVLADCKNVFDPPEEVRKLKSYQPDQVCTRYNMCLFCKNVVLMRHHLPALIVYQRQIKQAIGHNPTELPNAHHYERTLSVLESILNPSISEFSESDITWAVSVAENMDELIDPVVFRPSL